MFDLIALDADDTLWENEVYYTQAKVQFIRILAPYCEDARAVELRLDEIEEDNVSLYGYGIKSFNLSMIQAAIEISAGQVSTDELQVILGLGREMLALTVRLFPHTKEMLAELSKVTDLMLLTKGDVFEQTQKIRRTGLGSYFRHIEIVGEKTIETYELLLKRHAVAPSRFLMVGNSLKSDVLPVLELGGAAVYIPYENTWAHEMKVDASAAIQKALARNGYYQLEHLGQLPELVRRLTSG
jgi:putative hydrolase of the HAD superfamily